MPFFTLLVKYFFSFALFFTPTSKMFSHYLIDINILQKLFSNKGRATKLFLIVLKRAIFFFHTTCQSNTYTQRYASNYVQIITHPFNCATRYKPPTTLRLSNKNPMVHLFILSQKARFYQRLRIRMLRMHKNVCHGPLFNHNTVLHHHHLIRHRSNGFHIVRNKNICQPQFRL